MVELMQAAWYERFGAARDVLVVGEMEKPTPGPGEVLVRVHATGINPSDVKLRSGARPGAVMAYPRVVPHSDGAGVIEALGEGVAREIGERVWIWNASWQRAFGTAAEYVTVPASQAVRLPQTTSFAEGACLGIPAMTAWYALFADKPISGTRVLVTGGAGTVGRYACQMALLGGAGDVLTTVSSNAKARHSLAPVHIYYKESDVAETVMKITGGEGVDRVVDVDFAANQSDVLKIIKPGGVIASYASASVMRPELDFYGFMFKDVTLRMLIVYQLDGPQRRQGEATLTDWLERDLLKHAVVPAGGLENIAEAHELVESGDKLGTVVLEI